MEEKNLNVILVLIGIILILLGGLIFIKIQDPFIILFSGILVGWGSLMFSYPILLKEWLKRRLRKALFTLIVELVVEGVVSEIQNF